MRVRNEQPGRVAPYLIGIAICSMVVVAGCSPDLRSTTFTCTGQSDCDSLGRVCDQGWCVLPRGSAPGPEPDASPGPEPDAGTTPPDAAPNCDLLLAVDNQASTTNNWRDRVEWNHLVGNDANRLLIVGISFRDNYYPGETAIVESVKANNDDLARIGNGHGDLENVRTELWALLEPSPGNKSLEVRFAGRAVAVVGSLSFSGVDRNKMSNESSGQTGATSNASVTLSSSSTEQIVAVVGTTGASSSLNVGDGLIETWKHAENEEESEYAIRGAGGIMPGQSSVSPRWSVNPAADWSISAFRVPSLQNCQ